RRLLVVHRRPPVRVAGSAVHVQALVGEVDALLVARAARHVVETLGGGEHDGRGEPHAEHQRRGGDRPGNGQVRWGLAHSYIVVDPRTLGESAGVDLAGRLAPRAL